MFTSNYNLWNVTLFNHIGGVLKCNIETNTQTILMLWTVIELIFSKYGIYIKDAGIVYESFQIDTVWTFFEMTGFACMPG